MTTIKVTVEDESAELLKRLLREVSFVKNIEEEPSATNKTQELSPSYPRIKKLLDEAKGKNLFKDITDPSEWQRELRKEWDRDY